MIELKNVVKVYNADDTSVKALDNILKLMTGNILPLWDVPVLVNPRC